MVAMRSAVGQWQESVATVARDIRASPLTRLLRILSGDKATIIEVSEDWIDALSGFVHGGCFVTLRAQFYLDSL